MSKKATNSLIVGLDIGTSKVVAIVGEITLEGDIDIIGIGTQPPRGLKKGRRGKYRIDGTVNSARGRRSRTDGRLPDSFGFCWHCRQPYSQYQFAWDRRHKGEGSYCC